MNMADRNSRYPPPSNRRKTPSFSSSLLDSILRSIDETNDHTLQQQQQHHVHDQDLMFCASEPKRSSRIVHPQPHLFNEVEQVPSLRRAIMIDQWIETHNNNNNNNNNNNDGSSSNSKSRNCDGYVSRKTPTKFMSSDTSSSGTTGFTTSSSGTETPSTYRSLPNSFTISREDAQKANSIKREGKFMKSTRLKAMKIYGDLKKVKQPISPGSRISAFIHSLFASSSSKKSKIEESMQNFRSLKKSRSIKQDATMTCTSFSRSCMSKKQHSSSVKRSVRFYPETETVILDKKSVHERPLPEYERRWFTEKNYTKNYKKFVVNVEDDDEDEDEDDLFELEIVGGVGTCAYRQELPVFETTDLRKIRI